MIVMLFPLQVVAEKGEIRFTTKEIEFIERTQLGVPLKIGVIPHSFPLSACPPEVTEFTGTNVEMLDLISQTSGLIFEYVRIPIESKTPYEVLVNDELNLVAGTIRLDAFTNDPNLILSERFCDGSAICIAKKGTNPNTIDKGKVAVMHGYQAGREFASAKFPDYEIVSYPSNLEVIKAVRTGEADISMISRYVGIYELQNPLNEDLEVLPPYQSVVDSCIMGINNDENKVAMSIINKALFEIGDEESNHVQMNFTISNPYEPTAFEFFFKHRYLIFFGGFTVVMISLLTAKLIYSQKERSLLSKDNLTGAFTEAGFILATSKIIHKVGKPLFITDFDIKHFSDYNELNGKDKGDELLRNIFRIVKSFLSESDIICRPYADNFKVLSSKDSLAILIDEIEKASIFFNELVESKMVFKFGVYEVVDRSIPIAKMLDFASLAKKTVKNDSEKNIGVFDSAMHDRIIKDARMMSSFDIAINSREFVAYYQPKYDVNSKKIVGAEALVRWITSDGKMIPPIQFIELFERNGQIRRLDFYMLEQVCVLQKALLESGLACIPISVNFSRVHLFTNNFVFMVNQIVERYDIPKNLIEIECTETTMTYDSELTKSILSKLQSDGFSIAMDDFGKAYSSLNTLRAMPLDIVKLDGEFLIATMDNEKEKAYKIIRGVISLVHDLSLKIVAEGVETEEQYLFLKSVGCDYIQGYYFSRPVEEERFLDMLRSEKNSCLV